MAKPNFCAGKSPTFSFSLTLLTFTATSSYNRSLETLMFTYAVEYFTAVFKCFSADQRASKDAQVSSAFIKIRKKF